MYLVEMDIWYRYYYKQNYIYCHTVYSKTDSWTMVSELTLTKSKKRLKLVKWFMSLQIIMYSMQSNLAFLYSHFKHRKIFPTLLFLVIGMFPIMPLKSSITTKVYLNYIVLSIMQTTCNTHILVGVAGSSSSGPPRNETSTVANIAGSRFSYSPKNYCRLS